MSNQINQCWRHSVATQRKGSSLHGEAFHKNAGIAFYLHVYGWNHVFVMPCQI